MSEDYERLDQKPYESHYLHIETEIDHPVEEVWPHALNISSWMTDHRLEPLSGKAGEVGFFERVYACDLGPEVPQPHHHLYGIAHLIRHKLIALEVFPERGGSYGNTRDWMMFDSILLTELGGKTRVVMLMLEVKRGQREEGEGDTKENHDKLDEQGSERINRYFANLKALLKNRR